MKELISYNDRKIEVKAYSGSIERDLVLYTYSRNEKNPPKLKDIAFILKDNIKSNIPLNKLYPEELIYIFYTIRGISVSDSLSLSFDCPICKSKFNLNVDLSKILISKDYKCQLLQNVYSHDTDDYLSPGMQFRLNENINLYDRIINYIIKTKTKFNFKRDINCINCNSSHILDLSDLNILCSSFSSFDIQGFYNSINSLIYYGKCSADDVLNHLLPFERELLTGYIQAEIEKQEKNSQNFKS